MTLDDFLNHIEAGGALNTPEIYRLMKPGALPVR